MFMCKHSEREQYLIELGLLGNGVAVGNDSGNEQLERVLCVRLNVHMNAKIR